MRPSVWVVFAEFAEVGLSWCMGTLTWPLGKRNRPFEEPAWVTDGLYGLTFPKEQFADGSRVII